MAFKILLADDSMTAQNLAKKILTDVGYDVVAVSNGAAAMKKIASERPDLLILDIYMPGYTGLEVCEKIKAAAGTAHTPVLLTVAPMEPYDPADGNRVRADGVILKPFEARDLVPAVEKLAEQVTSARAATQSATAERNLDWKTNISVQPEVEAGQSGEDRDREFENSRPAPMPELPQEMAVAPAFLEQFGEEFHASPKQAIAGLISPASQSTGQAVMVATENAATENAAIATVAIETIDTELASQSLQEFDLLSQSLPEYPEEVELPSSEMEPSFSAEYPQPVSFSEVQAELETDAASASLGELGFAAGLSAESEPTASVDLDLTPEAPPANNAATVSEQDPELMVDRTQMIEFATRFNSDVTDSADDVPVGVASPGEFAEFTDPEADRLNSAEEIVGEIPEEFNATPGLETAPAEIDLAVSEFSPNAVSQDDLLQDEPGEIEQDTIRHQYQGSQERFPVQPDEMAAPMSMGAPGLAPFDPTEVVPAELAATELEPTEDEPTLDQEVEEALTQLPEFASPSLEEASLEEARFALTETTPSSEQPEQEPPAVEWSETNHAVEGARAGHSWQAADAAFGAIDASQFFQPHHPTAEELPVPRQEANIASTEIDEYALELALVRALDRLRPQIISEVIRELTQRD